MTKLRTFGALIIGDEIMRGKRQDGHFAKLREVMAARGLHLSWVHYLGDERPRLIDFLRGTLAGNDVVFSFGGIGVTPDDHTRQAAAAAAGVPLKLHPDADREIRARMAQVNMEVTPNRLQLGEFPDGSRIIPNPYNRIPGFSYRDHHFLPGFPQMSWPMLEWVLDTVYPECVNKTPDVEKAMIVWGGHEGLMLDLMRRIEADYPGLTVFSLPTLGSDTVKPHVEVGVRGQPESVDAAFAAMRPEIEALGYETTLKTA